eukprot:g358.t1
MKIALRLLMAHAVWNCFKQAPGARGVARGMGRGRAYHLSPFEVHLRGGVFGICRHLSLGRDANETLRDVQMCQRSDQDPPGRSESEQPTTALGTRTGETCRMGYCTGGTDDTDPFTA